MMGEIPYAPTRCVLDLGGYNGRASRPYVLLSDRWVVVDNRQYRKYGDWAEPALTPDMEFHEMDLHDWHESAEVVVCVRGT